jgi:Integrase zinc binding domain
LQHVSVKKHIPADFLSHPGRDKGEQDNQDIMVLNPTRLALMDGEPGYICFPEDIESRQAILQCYHDHPLAGHPGICNTIALTLCHFEDTKELRAFVAEYIKGCAKCQETKTCALRKTPLYCLDVPAEEGPFQSIAMDLITDLSQSSKYNAILTIIDQGCSKALCFLPCMKNITGEGVATLYL